MNACRFLGLARRFHSKPLTGLVGALALLGLIAAPPAARAGDTEVGALNAKLIAQGVLLSSANSSQLAAAIIAVLSDTAYNKLKSGVVIGEALKAAGSNAPDAGSVIGQTLVTESTTNIPLAARLGLPSAYVGSAALTAGTGKAPSVNQVAGFTQQVLSSNTDVTNAAVTAKSSKSAVSAIFAGRSSELAADLDRAALFQNALTNKSLLSLTQSISTGVITYAADPANLSNQLAQANTKYASNIVIGATAGRPTDAGAIVKEALNNANLPALKKSVATLAKSTAAIADIEQIEKIGSAVGAQIKTGAVKLSQAATITKTLVQAIIAKPFTTGLSTDPANANNKRDEVTETAAYMVASILGSAQLRSTTDAKTTSLFTSTILNIIKNAVAGAKSTKAGTPALSEVIADIVGSVSYTIKTATDDLFPTTATLTAEALRQAVLTTLTNTKNAAAIGGSANSAVVIAAANNAFDTSQVGANANRLENGNFYYTNPIQYGQLTDPETDTRNL